MSLKRNMAGLLSASLLTPCSGAVSAQDYPIKPVRMVVGSYPGGGPDFVARMIAQGITDGMGRQVVVDNRGNGAGELVSRSLPDGYTLLVDASSLWISPLLQKTQYDFARDFAPITMAVITSNALVVHPTIPVKSVKELIALAKSKPGALNYGSAPTGSNSHLATELFKSMAGVNVVRIAYKGSGPALNAMLGGEVQLMMPSAPSIAPHVKSGKLRALGVSTLQPSPLFPDLPTISATLPGYEAISPYGIFAPAKTPKAIIDRLNSEIVRVLKKQEVKDYFAGIGLETAGTSPEQFAAAVKSEMAKWGKLIKDIGITAE